MSASMTRGMVICASVAVNALGIPAAAQTVVLESAQLGTTGHTGGTSLSTAQYVGWRFEVAEPVVMKHVGGHLLSYPDVPGDIFAALVRLSTIDAFPAGAPFTDEEIIAATTFRADFPSGEVLTPLGAVLYPGSYALVFGTDLFGATGEGAIHNGPDQPDIPPTDIMSYIFFGIPGIGEPRIWRTNLAGNMRFVIEANRLADFDFDGDVDGRDFLIWQRGGSPRPVSAVDFADWQATYGTIAVSTTKVPEPPAVAWMLLVGVVLRRPQFS